MSGRFRFKKAIRIVGAILAVAGVGWIVWSFAHAGVWQAVVTSSHVGSLLRMIAIAIPVYFVGLLALSMAWWCLQSSLLAKRPPLRPLLAAYTSTQFAKYLPGNVGQYVGRHLILRRYNLSHAALLMSTLGEAGFLVLAALVLAGYDLNIIAPWLHLRPSWWDVLGIEAVVLLCGYFLLQWSRNRSQRFAKWVPLRSPMWLFGVLPLHLMFFGVMSFCVMLPASTLLVESHALCLLPAAVATSWIAGFLVIGSPAGIGVREMVFLAILHGYMPETEILVLVAAFRVITFSGDVLLFLFGLTLSRGLRREAIPE